LAKIRAVNFLTIFDKDQYRKELNMKTYYQKAMGFIGDEEGASAIEYGLLVALIALVIVAGATALGTSINALFTSASSKLDASVPS
jgi:pilus assembly protein Flp/PilA